LVGRSATPSNCLLKVIFAVILAHHVSRTLFTDVWAGGTLARCGVVGRRVRKGSGLVGAFDELSCDARVACWWDRGWVGGWVGDTTTARCIYNV